MLLSFLLLEVDFWMPCQEQYSSEVFVGGVLQPVLAIMFPERRGWNLSLDDDLGYASDGLDPSLVDLR
jgi:hypothetical protein